MENVENTSMQGSVRKGCQRVVNKENYEAFKQAARGLHEAYPEWTQRRIAATLGIAASTVNRMLLPDDAPKKSHKKKAQPTCDTLFSADFEEPPAYETPASHEYGTAPQTASIIAERDAIARMQVAAHELMAGARKLEETLGQFDALLKTAYVKGTQAATIIYQDGSNA